MEEVLGAAKLATEIPPERALTATLTRREIADALDEESAPTLFLDVARRMDDGTPDRASVGVTWERADLEELLGRIGEDQVTLTFDRDELEGAFSDVEAHGLRERLLVLTVAATAAVGTGAGIANAQVIVGDGGGASTAAPIAQVSDAASGAGYTAPATAQDSANMVTDVSSTGGYAAPSSADRILSDAASGSGYAAASSESANMVTDASSAGGYTAGSSNPLAGDTAAKVAHGEAMVTDASSAGGYTASSPSDSMVTDASSGSGYTAGSPSDRMVTDASSGSGYAAPATDPATSAISDAASGGGYPAPVATHDSGFLNLHAPSPADDAVLAAFGLAIAGAAFSTRRRGAPPATA